MKNVKTISNRKNINPADYVNTTTGELLSNEIPDVQSVNKLVVDKVMINYEFFVTIDTDAIDYLESKLSHAELGSVHNMINMIRDSSNFLFQRDGNHHSNVTLAKHFKYARSSFFAFTKRMMSLGVLYELKGLFDKGVERKYILNPYLARKTKLTDKNTLQYFNKISK